MANPDAQAQNGCAQPRWLRRMVRHHHRRNCLKASLKIRTPRDARVTLMMSENTSDVQNRPGLSCLVTSPGFIFENFIVSPVFRPTAKTQNRPKAARSTTTPAIIAQVGLSGFELSFGGIYMALMMPSSPLKNVGFSKNCGWNEYHELP